MLKFIAIDQDPLQGQCFNHILHIHFPEINYMGQAFSFESGLTLAREIMPDILFTDLWMSDIDGLEMIEQIKQICPSAQVCILTAWDVFGLIQEALCRVGVKKYLLKPLSYQNFIAQINSFLDSAHDLQEQNNNPKTSTCIADLTTILRSGSQEEIETFLGEIKEELFCLSNGEQNKFRAACISLVTEIFNKETNSNKTEIISILYKQFLNDIFVSSTSDSIFSHLCLIMEKIRAINVQNDSPAGYELIASVQKIIEERINEPITLEGIAQDLFFSPSYLSRLFKKQLGQNFSEYLMERRLERAKILLKSSNATIESISREVGYDNASSFRRFFKSRVGHSASQYRDTP